MHASTRECSQIFPYDKNVLSLTHLVPTCLSLKTHGKEKLPTNLEEDVWRMCVFTLLFQLVYKK